MALGKKISETDKALDFLHKKLHEAEHNNDKEQIRIIQKAIKEQRDKNFQLKKVKKATQWNK